MTIPAETRTGPKTEFSARLRKGIHVRFSPQRKFRLLTAAAAVVLAGGTGGIVAAVPAAAAPATTYYQIINHDGLCLDMTGASKANGADAQQWGCDGHAQQYWEVRTVNVGGIVYDQFVN